MSNLFLRASRLVSGRESSTSAAASLKTVLEKELDSIRAAGTWKVERVITSPQAAAIQVQEKEGKILNFCANNYLGLSVSIPHLAVAITETTACFIRRDLMKPKL